MSDEQKIDVPAGTLTVMTPAKRAVAVITEQDFCILQEGAGHPSDLAVRDVCLGIGAGAIPAFIGFYVLDRTPKSLIAMVVTGAIFAISVILAVLCHLRGKGDKGRRSYQNLVQHIERQLSAKTPAALHP